MGNLREWEDRLMSQRHPFTCGGDRGDQAHRDYQSVHGGDLGELVQSDSGLVCPVCGWKQPEPLHISQAAEIDQLKAELELRTKERDQAEGAGSLHIETITEENASGIYDGWRNIGKKVILGIGATEKFIAGYEESEPELFAHLAGRGE